MGYILIVSILLIIVCALPDIIHDLSEYASDVWQAIRRVPARFKGE